MGVVSSLVGICKGRRKELLGYHYAIEDQFDYLPASHPIVQSEQYLLSKTFATHLDKNIRAKDKRENN